MGEHNKIIGSRVREVYLRHNMTQADLAEALGYSDPNMISMIVNGRRRLTPEKALQMVELFPEVRLDWLLGRSNYESEAEEIMHNISDEKLRQDSLAAALKEFFQGTDYWLLTPSDHQGKLMPSRYYLSHGDEVAVLGPEEMDRLYSLIQRQITTQIDFLIQQVKAKKKDFELFNLLRKAERASEALEKQNPAPGADTPGAGAGQKADGPLPSDHTTEQEV